MKSFNLYINAIEAKGYKGQLVDVIEGSNHLEIDDAVRWLRRNPAEQGAWPTTSSGTQYYVERIA